MVTRNENLGTLLLKLAHWIGVVILVFWLLELGVNNKVHIWTDINLNHPVLMYVGFVFALFAIWRLIYWASVLKKHL